MAHDPFGNLQEWGSVLECLENLHGTGRLAECQRGLIRILRFNGNWRLREEVLNRLHQIESPTEDLIEEVFEIVADAEIYYEARILASKALSHLIKNRRRLSGYAFCLETQSVIEKLESLLRTTQPPVFHNALHDCLQSLA